MFQKVSLTDHADDANKRLVRKVLTIISAVSGKKLNWGISIEKGQEKIGQTWETMDRDRTGGKGRSQR